MKKAVDLYVSHSILSQFMSYSRPPQHRVWYCSPGLAGGHFVFPEKWRAASGCAQQFNSKIILHVPALWLMGIVQETTSGHLNLVLKGMICNELLHFVCDALQGWGWMKSTWRLQILITLQTLSVSPVHLKRPQSSNQLLWKESFEPQSLPWVKGMFVPSLWDKPVRTKEINAHSPLVLPL